MSKALERQIINKALNHVGLLSRSEAEFVNKISKWPSHWRLKAKQANWLYDIGEKKLNMVFERPAAPELAIDYKARACA